MTFEITPYPEFSWSISRQRLLDQCPYAYFCRYYLSHNGWLEEAEPQVRMAYRLGKLCSLDTELGHQIDERARELEACARGGLPLLPVEELEARTRRALNACWSSSKRQCDEFECFPNRVTMLRSLYLGQDPQAEIERVQEKLHSTHEALRGLPHWDRLRERGEEGRIGIPGFAHFFVDERGLADASPAPAEQLGSLKVFAAPDMAYVHRGVVHVIDWKSGREDGSNDLQVQLQAWWALETYPQLAGLELRGYLEYLAVETTDGFGLTRNVPLGGEWMAEAAQAVRDGVAQMRRLLADPVRNMPLEADAFDRREGVLCGGCNFSPLCH